MGLILDTSVLIASEKGRFRLSNLFEAFPEDTCCIASITASELLHGVERASPEGRKEARSTYVERILDTLQILDFDLAVARQHARIWASLGQSGLIIGAYDLLIAATALAYDHQLATLNLGEFRRVPSLRIVDIAPFAT